MFPKKEEKKYMTPNQVNEFLALVWTSIPPSEQHHFDRAALWEFGEVVLQRYHEKYPISSCDIARWFGYRDAEYVHDFIKNRRIGKKKGVHHGYIKGADYIEKDVLTSNNRNAKIYFVTLDCFEDMCMRMRGCRDADKGKALTVRKYFRVVHNLFKDYAEQVFQNRSPSAKEMKTKIKDMVSHYNSDPELDELADSSSMVYMDKITQNGHVFFHPRSHRLWSGTETEIKV